MTSKSESVRVLRSMPWIVAPKSTKDLGPWLMGVMRMSLMAEGIVGYR